MFSDVKENVDLNKNIDLLDQQQQKLNNIENKVNDIIQNEKVVTNHDDTTEIKVDDITDENSHNQQSIPISKEVTNPELQYEKPISNTISRDTSNPKLSRKSSVINTNNSLNRSTSNTNINMDISTKKSDTNLINTTTDVNKIINNNETTENTKSNISNTNINNFTNNTDNPNKNNEKIKNDQTSNESNNKNSDSDITQLLQKIIKQMDVLTQTINIMESRLTVNENRVSRLIHSINGNDDMLDDNLSVPTKE